MRDILGQIERWTAGGERCAVATVVATRRSAPRAPGTKMAVSESGAVAGGVSGGCVEAAVVEASAAVLADGTPRLARYGFSDDEAREVGLPCGGEIDVWIEPWSHDGLAAAVRSGARAARVTALDGDRRGAHLLLLAGGSVSGTLGDGELDAAAIREAAELLGEERSAICTLPGAEVFVDVVAPPPRLIVVGAIDLAASICTLGRAAGFVPYVIDPRGRFATRERFPDAEQVVVAWPEAGFAGVGGLDRATAVCVLTHDPKIDDPALVCALRSEAGYVGAMGSRRAQAARRERLLALGVSDEDLARLAAPIGLDLGALAPEETALSIVAEIVAVRHGRDGGRLEHARGRIHDLAG